MDLCLIFSLAMKRPAADSTLRRCVSWISVLCPFKIESTNTSKVQPIPHQAIHHQWASYPCEPSLVRPTLYQSHVSPEYTTALTSPLLRGCCGSAKRMRTAVLTQRLLRRKCSLPLSLSFTPTLHRFCSTGSVSTSRSN
jgi:hypothetical protein